MVDVMLMVTNEGDTGQGRLLIVGDIDQLPSVGPGRAGRYHLIRAVPVVRLTEVFRQAAQSHYHQCPSYQ
jgi:exodeoxyribonuclease V alpha subunit